MNRWKIGFVVVLVFIFASLGVVDCQAANVTIHRDDWGVPHIYADTVEGLYYGWGYASAEDRLFQLEMLRRAYYGQVSELFGADHLAIDEFWIREYPRKEAMLEEYNNLDPKYQKIIQAYADGINAWIDEVLADPDQKLSLEFHQLGIQPEHFSVVDISAVIMANLGLFMDLYNEMWHLDVYAHLQEQYGDQADLYFDDLAWDIDPSAYTTIKPEDLGGKKYEYAAHQSSNQLAQLNTAGLKGLAKSAPNKTQLVKDLLTAMGLELPEKVAKGHMESMSYGVIVDSKHSATGNPWLMGGPQVDYYLPGLVYEVGLHGPGYDDVVGTTLIGAPYLMFGASRTTAFTCTAGADNVVDIFEEKLNPKNPHQYLYKGEWVDMNVRTQEIKIKDAESKIVTNYDTVHGPVIAQVDTDGDGINDLAYSKKVACNDSYLDAVIAYTELSVAKTKEEFLQAGSSMGPVLNFFWANNQGDIGYYHAGKLPIRPEGVDLRFPLPGTGEYEWKGFMAAKDHPQVINPSYGFIINWNNKPAPGFGNGDLSSIFTWAGWSVDQRVNNLDRLVREKAPIDRKDIEEVIHEIADANLEAVAIKEYLVQALADVDEPRLVKVRQYLMAWDNLRNDKNHDGYYDEVATIIFDEWWNQVNKDIFADELAPFWDGWYNFGGLLYNYGGYSLLIRTVLGEEAAVPVKADWYNGQKWEDVFVASLEKALDHLTEKYGTADLGRWKKEIKTMPFLPTLIDGTPSTFGEVNEVKYMDRGSENHIVELTSPVVTGKIVVPPGQSGFISKDGTRHEHFADQLTLYANWTYKDMYFLKGDVLLNAESTKILIYTE